MLKNLFLLLTLLQLPSAFADEPAPSESTSPDDIAKLIGRIDQLESRIKELERQAAVSKHVVVPRYQPFNSQQYKPLMPNSNLPPIYSPQQSTSPAPLLPQTHPPVIYQQPYQPNAIVPDSWKPFNFNGAWFYIIPVHEAERISRRQSGASTN